MMSTLLLQLTLTDLTGEDAGEYSCLLLTVEGGQVDKGTGSVTLQVIVLMMMPRTTLPAQTPPASRKAASAVSA